jgi:hypothetical protein
LLADRKFELTALIEHVYAVVSSGRNRHVFDVFELARPGPFPSE